MKKYYNVTMVSKNEREDGAYSINCKFIVNDMNELEQHIREEALKECKTIDDFIISYEESTIDEFINTEKTIFKKTLITRYLDRHEERYGSRTVKEHNNIIRNINKELYFEILQEENKLVRIDKVIRLRFDVNKLTISEYDELKEELLNVNTEEEYNELIKRYPARKW